MDIWVAEGPERPRDVIGSVATTRMASRWSTGAGYAPGLALVVVIGAISVAIEQLIIRLTGSATGVIEALVIAILIGILIRNTVASQPPPRPVSPWPASRSWR
jgi:carbon starvation protein CstA